MDKLLQRALVSVSNRDSFGTSMIQRICHIGYNRAAHMVDDALDKGFLARLENEPSRLKLTAKGKLKANALKVPPALIGDIVMPLSSDYPLVSGASVYDYAYVVSIVPFVVVSELGDMRWQSTVKPESFRVIGHVLTIEMEKQMQREFA